MRVHCPQCRRIIAVPDDKAANPALKVKCAGCAAIFLFSQASLALAEPAPAPAPDPAPVRPSPPPAAPSGRPAAAGPRRCANHPQARSESVCPKCRKGWCAACGTPVQSAIVCPSCGGLCVAASKHEEGLEKDRRRARPMGQELGTIVSYPFVDKLAYVLLAVVTWLFGLTRGFGIGGVLLSDGLLMAYSFAAVSKVSGGNFKHYMPDFRDISDLADPLRLGLAALIISWGPLFALGLFVALPSVLAPLGDAAPAAVVRAQQTPPEEEPEAEEPQTPEEKAEAEEPPVEKPEPQPAWIVPAMVLAALWKLVYTPVALTVAALTRSFWQTLNPLLGAGTILRMGSTYWAAAAIYTVIAGLEWGLGLGLRSIPVPLVGGFVKSFVAAWAYLAIGCTLGLAAFKKARELELE